MTPERMASADAAWLHMDQPTNLMVVNSVFWFEASLDWDDIREVLLERLVAPFPRFRQRVDDPLVTVGNLTAPRWVDDEAFDIGRHLRHGRVRGSGTAALQRYVSDRIADPLPTDRPLWEAHLLDVPRLGSAILLRTHHAIADGTALMHVLLTLRDPTENGQVDIPGDAVTPALAARTTVPVLERIVDATATATGRAARLAGTVAREYAGVVVNPRRLLDVADAARVDAAMIAKLGFGVQADHSELFGPLGIDKKVLWSRPVDLDLVKTVGRQRGATVNDVMLAVLAGGLRRHLAAGGHEVKDVLVIVPYNIRSADELVTPTLGNRFGLVFLPLPATLGDAPGRIAQVKRQMDHIKATNEGLFVYGVLAAAGRTPKQLQRAWIDIFAGKADAIVTNIAGPRHELSLTGVPLRGFVAWVPATGPVGVGLSIVSYNGSVVIGLVADASVVPDSAGLLRAIESEIRALRRLALTTGSSHRRSRTRQPSRKG